MRTRNHKSGGGAAGTAALVLAITLLVMAAAAVPQQPAPAAPSESPFTIAVSVDEVVLHASVRNHHGTPVAGLAKNDFQVFEDGAPQSITHFSHADIPVTVGLVIDNSGSMRPKRAEVIAAALAFVASSNPQDQVFLVNFNENVRFGLPRNVPFTDQPDQLKVAMGSVMADGETALYDAVIIALEHIAQGNRDKKVLIVISDGADNASSHSKAQMLAAATKSGVIIYGLGIYEPDDPDRNPGVVRQLARAGGGESFFPPTLREVAPTCERIAHDIRNQYTLTYVPTNQKQDGRYRVIQVRATSSKGDALSVTTRAGYFAPAKAASPGAIRPEPRN